MLIVGKIGNELLSHTSFISLTINEFNLQYDFLDFII
jgi:hypothetical protein